jgi:hypothetical protein
VTSRLGTGKTISFFYSVAAVSFPIIGVDFLRHFQFMVDPAANMLVDKASLQSFATVSSVTGRRAAGPAASPAALPAAPPSPPAAVEQAALPTVTCPQSPVHSHRSTVTGPQSPVSEQWPRRRRRPRFQRTALKSCWQIFQLWSTAPRRCRNGHPGTWSIISSPRARCCRAASATLTAKSWPRRKRRSSCRWRETASFAALTALGPFPCTWCEN